MLITLQALKIGIWMIGVMATAAGAVLLLSRAASLDQRPAFVRWLLRTDIGPFFDRRFVIERGIYRRHRLVGALVLVGAVAALVLLVLATSNPHSIGLRKVLGVLGFRVAVAVIGAAAVALLLAGFCLIVRPSILKGVESAANRWIAPSNRGADLSSVIQRAPRLVGGLLMAGGLACLWPY